MTQCSNSSPDSAAAARSVRAPGRLPALDRAKALLEDFGTLWQAEQDPVERRKLIATLFEQIWQKEGRSWPSNLARYFTTVEEAQSKHPKACLHSRVTKAGATGVEPSIVASRIEIRL